MKDAMRFYRRVDGTVYSDALHPDEQIEVSGQLLALVADGQASPGVAVTATIEPLGSLAHHEWPSLTIETPTWSATYDLDRPATQFAYYLGRDTWRGTLREVSADG